MLLQAQADAEYHQAVAKRAEAALADQRSQTAAAQAGAARNSAQLRDALDKLQGAATAADEARQTARMKTQEAQV